MIKPTAAAMAILLAGCSSTSPQGDDRILSAEFDPDEGYSYEFSMWRETDETVRLDVAVEFDHESPDARFWVDAEAASFTQPAGEPWEYRRNWSGSTDSKETFTFLANGPHELPADLVFTYENPVGERLLRQRFLLTITEETADGTLVGEAREISPSD